MTNYVWVCFLQREKENRDEWIRFRSRFCGVYIELQHVSQLCMWSQWVEIRSPLPVCTVQWKNNVTAPTFKTSSFDYVCIYQTAHVESAKTLPILHLKHRLLFSVFMQSLSDNKSWQSTDNVSVGSTGALQCAYIRERVRSRAASYIQMDEWVIKVWSYSSKTRQRKERQMEEERAWKYLYRDLKGIICWRNMDKSIVCLCKVTYSTWWPISV